MMPDAFIESLRTVRVHDGSGKTFAEILLERREANAAEFAARFPKGPPLCSAQRYFNRALEDMKAALRDMETAQDSAEWKYVFAVKSFAGAKASAIKQAELAEKFLERPLTEREWLEGFPDPYADPGS